MIISSKCYGKLNAELKETLYHLYFYDELPPRRVILIIQGYLWDMLEELISDVPYITGRAMMKAYSEEINQIMAEIDSWDKLNQKREFK